MFFGFALLARVVGFSGILRYYGGVYAFIIFICIVSGILVVFAYRIALVPLLLEEEEADEIISKHRGLFKSLGKFKLGWSLSLLRGLGVFLLITLINFNEPGVKINGFQRVSYVCFDWAAGIRLFGFLLFLVMVFCVGVAGKYKGALIG